MKLWLECVKTIEWKLWIDFNFQFCCGAVFVFQLISLLFYAINKLQTFLFQFFFVLSPQFFFMQNGKRWANVSTIPTLYLRKKKIASSFIAFVYASIIWDAGELRNCKTFSLVLFSAINIVINLRVFFFLLPTIFFQLQTSSSKFKKPLKPMAGKKLCGNIKWKFVKPLILYFRV